MSYQFAGFFATSDSSLTIELPEKAVLRNICTPFQGLGIRLSHYIGQSISSEDVVLLATQLGLTRCPTWIFLQYDCFGGQIDYVFGVIQTTDRSIKTIEESNLEDVQNTYLDFMKSFGLSNEDALNFPPFHRGFWGETA